MADIERSAKCNHEVARRQGVVVLLKEIRLGCRRVGDVGREQVVRRTLGRVLKVGNRTRDLLQPAVDGVLRGLNNGIEDRAVVGLVIQ